MSFFFLIQVYKRLCEEKCKYTNKNNAARQGLCGRSVMGNTTYNEREPRRHDQTKSPEANISIQHLERVIVGIVFLTDMLMLVQ